MKALTAFFACVLGVSIPSFAKEEVLHQFKVVKLNQRVMESFGEAELKVWNPHIDSEQTSSVVSVISDNGKLKMRIGDRVFNNAQRYDVPLDSQIAYNVESPDIEIGYLLVINAFSDKTARLSGYTTDIPPGQTIDSCAERFADLEPFSGSVP